MSMKPYLHSNGYAFRFDPLSFTDLIYPTQLFYFKQSLHLRAYSQFHANLWCAIRTQQSGYLQVTIFEDSLDKMIIIIETYFKYY